MLPICPDDDDDHHESPPRGSSIMNWLFVGHEDPCGAETILNHLPGWRQKQQQNRSLLFVPPPQPVPPYCTLSRSTRSDASAASFSTTNSSVGGGGTNGHIEDRLLFAVISGNTLEVKRLLSRKNKKWIGTSISASSSSIASFIPEATACSTRSNADLQFDEGCVVNTKNSYGWSLLHYASVHGHEDTARFLLHQGADIMAKTRSNGDTPLHLASQRGRLKMACFLMDHGADPFTKNGHSETPLDVADHARTAKAMRKHYDKIEDETVTTRNKHLPATVSRSLDLLLEEPCCNGELNLSRKIGEESEKTMYKKLQEWFLQQQQEQHKAYMEKMETLIQEKMPVSRSYTADEMDLLLQQQKETFMTLLDESTSANQLVPQQQGSRGSGPNVALIQHQQTILENQKRQEKEIEELKLQQQQQAAWRNENEDFRAEQPALRNEIMANRQELETLKHRQREATSLAKAGDFRAEQGALRDEIISNDQELEVLILQQQATAALVSVQREKEDFRAKQEAFRDEMLSNRQEIEKLIQNLQQVSLMNAKHDKEDFRAELEALRNEMIRNRQEIEAFMQEKQEVTLVTAKREKEDFRAGQEALVQQQQDKFAEQDQRQDTNLAALRNETLSSQKRFEVKMRQGQLVALMALREDNKNLIQQQKDALVEQSKQQESTFATFRDETRAEQAALIQQQKDIVADQKRFEALMLRELMTVKEDNNHKEKSRAAADRGKDSSTGSSPRATLGNFVRRRQLNAIATLLRSESSVTQERFDASIQQLRKALVEQNVKQEGSVATLREDCEKSRTELRTLLRQQGEALDAQKQQHTSAITTVQGQSHESRAELEEMIHIQKKTLTESLEKINASGADMQKEIIASRSDLANFIQQQKNEKMEQNALLASLQADSGETHQRLEVMFQSHEALVKQIEHDKENVAAFRSESWASHAELEHLIQSHRKELGYEIEQQRIALDVLQKDNKADHENFEVYIHHHGEVLASHHYQHASVNVLRAKNVKSREKLEAMLQALHDDEEKVASPYCQSAENASREDGGMTIQKANNSTATRNESPVRQQRPLTAEEPYASPCKFVPVALRDFAKAKREKLEKMKAKRQATNTPIQQKAFVSVVAPTGLTVSLSPTGEKLELEQALPTKMPNRVTSLDDSESTVMYESQSKFPSF